MKLSSQGKKIVAFCASFLFLAACPDPLTNTDRDAALRVDAGTVDSGVVDSSSADTLTPVDANSNDTADTDAEVADATVDDAAGADATLADATVDDAAGADATLADATVDDAAGADATTLADATVDDAAGTDATLGDATVDDAASADATADANSTDTLSEDAGFGQDASQADAAGNAKDAAPSNSAPTANAGADQGELPVNRPVQLNGSQSSDPDGDALTYLWSVVNSPAGASPTLDHPDASTPILMTDLPGSYTVQLVVTDVFGLPSDADSVVVDVAVRVAIFGDYFPTRLLDGLASTGWTLHGFSGQPDSHISDIAGDWLLASESVGQGTALVAYNLPHPERRVIDVASTDSGSIGGGRSDGAHVVYSIFDPNGVGPWTLKLYNLATGSMTTIATGTGSQPSAYVEGDYLAFSDNRDGAFDIFFYQISTAQETRISSVGIDMRLLGLSMGYIVYDDPWERPVSYQISTGTRKILYFASSNTRRIRIDGAFGVASSTGPEHWLIDLGSASATLLHADANSSAPQIVGDNVMWVENSGGTHKVWRHQISTAQTDMIASGSGQLKTGIWDGGDYMVQQVINGGKPDLHLYQISTDSTVPLATQPYREESPRWHGGKLYFTASVSGYRDILMTSDLGRTTELISAGKSLVTTAIASTYNAAVFGDNMSTTYSLNVFDRMSAQAVGVVGIGTSDNSYPLGSVFSNAGRLGISQIEDYGCAPLAIDVAPSEASHPIFTGLNVSSTVILENAYGEADEMVWTTQSSAADSPTDWTVLANLGPDACGAGQATLVSFTTTDGTRVILDGAAPTYDGYQYWTADRWTVLINELAWVGGVPVP